MMMMQNFHKPVLLNEVIDFLAPKPGGIYADCTLGGGGHASEILKRIGPNGVLIGIDRDEEAIRHSAERLSEYGDRVRLMSANFRNIGEALEEMGATELDGVLLDLGISSHQVDSAERGFSFLQDAPLDMRMDRSQSRTAADLLNRLPERELTDLIRNYSDERWAKRIAKFIVERRKTEPIRSTGQLADLVAGAIPKAAWPPTLHPATRTFQALRIAVNEEMEALEDGLKAAVEALKPDGRIVVISYHSGEDRRVKQAFRLLSGQCECPRNLPQCVCGAATTIEVLTKKPVSPTEEEIETNPRARSARLRAAKKL